ncbi:ABC transporter substrate-binding protein [Pectobacterium parmentieri]|uniref:ABC transporter substrate-binding protein n=1 Tax=Pectobacterium parmentieri TaxID=1905730 RepID=A0A8B3FBF8_PECPM|nr:ABC transporter substrate-binding protein [Pectobacterium parmentieri]AYH10800.1 ABC transporter substrate-binding protein [Pectobacterium parmentieri]AYH18489.1 ABC transporter substrate-binding protein [Pectobacterium parmentieri]AYH37082.1 ABC transporter substrate-binding protein [Pectobacterium parmentieri]AZS57312.1 ABC transporter substrate-binding protein [Pectobacterium parmentieri]MBI0429776.1 ABC transporter substrate-binding protein [Pectobacterium parmentieri]
MKISTPSFLFLLSLFTSPAIYADVVSRQVTDDVGHSVVLKGPVLRIADAWYAHHSLLMALGVGDRIVATVNHPEDRPWMFKVQPSLNSALRANGLTFNSESLLSAGIDAVFVSRGNSDAEVYRQAKLPVLEMFFNDYPSMKRSMLNTAQAIGTPEALQRAEHYNQYLEETVAAVSQKTNALSEKQRPRVLHIASLEPLKIDGNGTLVDTWITLAGGRNAAASVKGNLHEVSPEEVLAWQPDIIIIGGNAGEISQSPYADLFKGLDAVRHQRVWKNPVGVFPWDRYGVETALQLKWAASRLHPDLFADIDMTNVTQDFYSRFFNYALSTEDAKRILAALPPSGNE